MLQMNKVLSVGMAALMAAGFVQAQEDVVMVGSVPQNDPAETQVTIEGALVSSHVWRGQVRNNDFVFQPQLTASQYGVSVNVWANYDLGENFNGVQGENSEIDFSIAYTLPLDINDVTFDIGLIRYHYPANGDFGTATESTTEAFAKATVQTFRDYFFVPSVTFFGDFDEADGTYVLFDFAAPYQVSDYLAVEAGFSAGWGNTSYNDYYWGHGLPGSSTAQVDKGFNDFNFYGSASYEIMEGLYAALSLQYTILDGGEIKNAGEVRYEAGEKFFGGVNIAYDF
jgi:hypothetical protein